MRVAAPVPAAVSHPAAARPHGASPAAVITGAVTNHGGPVLAAPKAYVVYWGWSSDPSGEQAYLNNFLS
jgi:hypothetical protein